MRRLLGFVVALALAGSAFADAQTVTGPSVRVVFFTADWCPNCQVLAPRLAQAMDASPDAERIDIDITDSKRWDASLEWALDKRVVRVYNAYLGTTGFAVLVATDSGESLSCVTRLHNVDQIRARLRQAVAQIRAHPPLRRTPAAGAADCPPKRPQPPS